MCVCMCEAWSVRAAFVQLQLKLKLFVGKLAHLLGLRWSGPPLGKPRWPSAPLGVSRQQSRWVFWANQQIHIKFIYTNRNSQSAPLQVELQLHGLFPGPCRTLPFPTPWADKAHWVSYAANFRLVIVSVHQQRRREREGEREQELEKLWKSRLNTCDVN